LKFVDSSDKIDTNYIFNYGQNKMSAESFFIDDQVSTNEDMARYIYSDFIKINADTQLLFRKLKRGVSFYFAHMYVKFDKKSVFNILSTLFKNDLQLPNNTKELFEAIENNVYLYGKSSFSHFMESIIS